MADAIWQLDNVSLAGSGSPRLAGVTLSIQPGVTAVLGASGAGKTSLLNLLVAFERPTRGSVGRSSVAGGRLPVYWSPPDHGLWPDRTVLQHVMHAMPSPNDRDATALLGRFDLDGLASRYPSELSLGERSRLSVVRALASDAAALVMDEPLAHVDDMRADRFWQALADTIATRGVSLVFASHDAQRVMSIADHAICLEASQVTYTGSVASLYEQPPTEALAALLGPCNWFDPNARRIWLPDSDDRDAPCGIRPEQLSLEPAADSLVMLESTRRVGAIARSVLTHEHESGKRPLVHRVFDKAIKPGDRVAVRLCQLLMLLLLLAAPGCTRGDSPELRVRAMRSWRIPPVASQSPAPRAMTIAPNGEMLVLDTAGRILVYSRQGEFERSWDMPSNDVGNPEGIIVLKDGRIAVADTHYSRVVFFNPDGSVQSMLGERGDQPGQFIYPVKIVQDDAGDIYVAEYGSNDRVQKFSANGELICVFGSFGTNDDQFQRPSGMVWRDGTLFVADAMNNRVLVFDDDGTSRGVLGAAIGAPPALHFPYDLTLGPDDRLYVAEYGGNRITCLDLDGRVVGRFGEGGRDLGHFITPWGLAVNDDLSLRVADTGNRRIVELQL